MGELLETKQTNAEIQAELTNSLEKQVRGDLQNLKNEIMQQNRLTLPSDLEKKDSQITDAKLEQKNGHYEYRVAGNIKETTNMLDPSNDVLRQVVTSRFNKLIAANPGMMVEPTFSVSKIGGTVEIKIAFTIDPDKQSTISSIDSYGFFATGTNAKALVDAGFAGGKGNNWRNSLRANYGAQNVSTPNYTAQDVQNTEVTSGNGLGVWEYTNKSAFRMDFAVIKGQNLESEREAQYPDRETKFREGYAGLSSSEKSFFGIVAETIQKNGTKVYEEQVDGYGENPDAKTYISNIAQILKPQGYTLSISSSYRGPQKQFEEFFEKRTKTLANGQIVPSIPNFIPTEILDKQGHAKPGYEKQYQEVLDSYKKRAAFVAPPGFSEHQTGRAFDFKLKKDTTNIETLLGDEKYGDVKGNNLAKTLLEKAGFKQSYTREPRHWYYEN